MAVSEKVFPVESAIDFDVCDFPRSLKDALEQALTQICRNITIDHLKQVSSLTLRDIDEEQTRLLSKRYADFVPALKELDISDNPGMQDIPEFVLNIYGLKKLNISQTGISEFPEDICNLENLTDLIASHNNYTGSEVPFETFCLSHLKVLDMSYSNIRYVDQYIGTLSHLEEFYMAGNNLVLTPRLFNLPHLQLVDFRNNNLRNEALNTYQSCNAISLQQECQEDFLSFIRSYDANLRGVPLQQVYIALSIESKDLIKQASVCNAIFLQSLQQECQEKLRSSIRSAYRADDYLELDFPRGEPLRQMYINLARQNEALMEQCNAEDGDQKYCPNFITECKGEYSEESEELQCMLDVFESVRGADSRHKLNQDVCYHMWVGYLVDYENSPELLNKTIRGITIRELRYLENEQGWSYLFSGDGWFRSAPDKYPAEEWEVVPEKFRTPGISTVIEALVRRGDLYYWVPEDCPHLPSDLKEQIEEIVVIPWWKQLLLLLSKDIDL